MSRTVALSHIRDDAPGFIDALKWTEIVEVTDGDKVISVIYVPRSWDEASGAFAVLSQQGNCQATSDGLALLTYLNAFLEAPSDYIREAMSSGMRLKVCRTDIYSCVFAAVPR